MNLPESEGVVISDVQRGSIAGIAGLKPGDIILEIDKTEIATLAEYSKVIEGIKPGDTVLFQVMRGNNTLYSAVRVPKGEGEGKASNE